MFEGKYILADMCIGIRSLYDEVQRMCEDYRAPMDSTPEFIVETTEQDIEAERIQSEETRIEEGLPPYAFDAAYLETLAVYRQIATECVLRGRLLMHGSVVAVDGRAYMFTAKSGTGKSTHVRLWRKLFGERAVMVNDDKPLLRIRRVSGDDLPADEESVLVYGTPWDGKHRLSTNMSAPLEAICILTRAKENTIMTGITTELAIIWFFEKIPTQAPARIEIIKPTAITPRKKSLCSQNLRSMTNRTVCLYRTARDPTILPHTRLSLTQGNPQPGITAPLKQGALRKPWAYFSKRILISHTTWCTSIRR